MPRHATQPTDYPLSIVSPKSHGFLNSCYANMEHKLEGDRVRVANGRGAFKGVACVTDDVNPGVVVAILGYWHQLNSGAVNCVSSAEFTEMGHAPSFSDNLVEVTRAKQRPLDEIILRMLVRTVNQLCFSTSGVISL